MPQKRLLRRAFHRFIPAGFHDPVGLARRLLQSENPAAIFALRAALLGPLLMPLDLLLAPLEHLRYRRAPEPQRPILLICGPARSGTTVTAQLLIQNLPVSYFSNLTSVFPRAPLTAESIFGRQRRQTDVSFRSYYGRTSGWSGPNDALYVWDRWFGSDRTRIPQELAPAVRQAMLSFFGARERQTGQPTLGKNNALNACAHLVAEALPTARFICLERSRVTLALSLLRARVEIHGRPELAYGLMPPDCRQGNDPVEDICRQILFHEQLARRQLERLGPERFVLVRYEDVCRNPREFVERIRRDVLGEKPDDSEMDPITGPRSTTNRPEDPTLTDRIEKTFDRISRGES
ncbi:MAG TPA: sulfotransferase [Steroidobacteraceae bacterium]